MELEDHIAKNSRTSYGIACCKYNKQSRKWNILLVKKRYSYCFVAFVFGQYTKNDDKRIKYLFNNMTYQEKIDIMCMRFDFLWYKIWLEMPKISDKKMIEFNLEDAKSIVNTWKNVYKKKEDNTNFPYMIENVSKLDFYIKRKNKFESIFTYDGGKKLRSIIEGTRNIELEWEIPKGRKQRKETNINCSIREFKEETFNSMGICYTHNYYMAFAHTNFEPKNVFHNNNNMCEIDSVKWVDTDELKFIDTSTNIRLTKIVLRAINIMKSKYARS